MSPEQNKELQRLATSEQTLPYVRVLAQAVIELAAKADAPLYVVQAPGRITRASEWPLDRDGGADPIGRCAEPTYQDEHREANARYRRAVDQIRIGDRVDFMGENCEVLGEEGDGAAQASISGAQSRARVRDELAEMVARHSLGFDKGTAAMCVDRILDRLVNATYGTPACGHLSAIRNGAR